MYLLKELLLFLLILKLTKRDTEYQARHLARRTTCI